MPATPLYLVDGSAYVYRAFHALPPLTGPSGLPTNAAYGFTSMLLKLLGEAQPQRLAIVFDAPGGTFRDELFEEYKQNRPEAPADLIAQWPTIHQIVDAFRIRSLSVAGVEADDVIGSLAQRAAHQGIDCIIVTSDKDLMQLVGPHVRLWDTMRDRWTDEKTIRERFGVTPAQIVEIMGLMGDPVDNVPGVKGIGEKTAAALIQKFGSIDALFADLDAVAALDLRGAKRIAGQLREHADEARLSRKLVEIRCDVPLDADPADLEFEGPDTAALRALFSQLGFQSLGRDLPAPAPPPEAEPRRCERVEEVVELAQRLRQAPRIALACVATGHPMATPCAGVVLASDDVDACLVPARPELLPPLAAVLGSGEVEKVGHDVKADILWLERLGLSIDGPLFDLEIASFVASASPSHRLEELSAALLDEPIEPFRDREPQPAGIAAGCRRMLRLRRLLGERLEAGSARDLFFDVEMPLVSVLARMERHGVLIDVEGLRRMGREWQQRAESLQAEIHSLAGGEFNANSAPQLREVLFERLGLPTKGVRRGKTGLSTDVDVLTRLAEVHPLPAKILEYRGIAKLLSTYVDTLATAVHPQTGRVHTIFHPTGAATGRLSSSDPNLQNIPARGEEGRRVRSIFIARDGAFLVSADYSQIELRVMAHLSEDPVLVAAFTAGEDIHERTAMEIFGALPGTVTADMRRVAKVINFGIMYGMGPQRLAGELGIATAAAQRYIGQYFERYSGVRSFIDRTIAAGKRDGFVQTLFGRRRTMPELQARDRGTLQAAERAAINAPIQGTAADLIKIAMVRIDRRLREGGSEARMILQVHDELLLEVPAGEVDSVTALVRREMEGAAALRVPLAVEIGCGRNWAEAH